MSIIENNSHLNQIHVPLTLNPLVRAKGGGRWCTPIKIVNWRMFLLKTNCFFLLMTVVPVCANQESAAL